VVGRVGTGIPTFKEIYDEAAKIERRNGGSREEMEESLARLLGTAEAAERVKQGMIEEFGSEIAENALRNVSQTTNKDLRQGMTLDDLDLLDTELHAPALAEPRRRVPNDTEEVIKDELASNWASAADEEYYKMPGEVGPIMDVPKEAFSPVQWPDDAKVGGLRSILYSAAGRSETYAVKEKYHAIQWPNSDATVGLRDSVYEEHVKPDDMRFDLSPWAPGLELIRGRGGDSEENKLPALANFIGEHFEMESGHPVAPGHPAFQNIANNILSYLPRGEFTVAAKGREIASGYVHPGARPREGGAIHSRTRLEVTEAGNVRVYDRSSVAFLDVVGADDTTTYTLERTDEFVISGEHLVVDPTAFDAKANLVSVKRSYELSPWTTKHAS
jgi:hypothetical protein